VEGLLTLLGSILKEEGDLTKDDSFLESPQLKAQFKSDKHLREKKSYKAKKSPTTFA